MLYSQKLWNCDWIGNKGNQTDQKKRAHNVTLMKCPRQEVCIHSLTPHNNRERRLWTHIEPNKLIKLIKLNHGIYETIMENRKRKVYFDIDGKEEDKLEKAIKIINDYFPKNAQLNISGSKENNSYHIVINNYFFNNQKEQRILARLMDIHNDIFDNKVYTKDRYMKCINQSKPNSYTQSYISGSKNIKDHLITCFFPKESYDASNFLPNLPVNEIEKVNKPKWTINNIPQLNLTLPNDEFDFYQATPIEILSIIPNPKRTEKYHLSHRDIWCVANYCKYNSISFEEFWSWCSKKDNSPERASKWFNHHWNGTLENVNYQYGYNEIGKFLERFYPDILKDKKKKIFLDYHNIIGTKIIDKQYISVDDFTDKKADILALGLGANKTGSMLDYLKRNEDNSFILMTPRITLGHNIEGRMNEIGLNYTSYKSFQNAKSKQEKMPFVDNLIIQCQSLHYLQNRPHKYNIVVIDEIESVLNIWKENNTLKDSILAKCWKVFTQFLLSADKLILIDALLSKKTLRFLNSIGIKNNEISIIKRCYEPKPRDLIIMPKNSKFDEWVQAITYDLCLGKKVFVFYPFKDGGGKYPSMTVLLETIKLHYVKEKGHNLNSIFYTADTDDKIKKGLYNVNDVWKEQTLVMCNQCITVGVNYDQNDYDVAYIAYSNFVLPRDIVQVSMRIRNLRENQVKLFRIKNSYSKQDCEKGYIVDDNHKQLVNDIIREEQNASVESLYHLFKIANYKVKQDKNTKNEVNENFFFDYQKLLEETQCKFSFKNIPVIDHEYAELLYENTWYGSATYEDKLQLQKYNFTNQFISTLEHNTLCELWNNKNMFSKYHEFDEHSWMKDLMKELNITNLIIPKKVKISNELRNKIFNEFNFDRLKRDCNDKMLISRALNAYFKPYNIYNWKKTDSNHGDYVMDELFIQIIDQAEMYFKKYNKHDFTQNVFS